MSFVAGLLRGFNQRTKEARDQARADQDQQDAREDKILSVLAQSDDPEVAHSAVLASLDKATGAKAPKGGFLASLMGPRTAAHPAIESLLKLANSPTTKAIPGPATDTLSFEPAGTTEAPKAPVSTGPPPPVGAAPSAPQVGTPPPPPAPAAPGSAAMPPVPTPGSMAGGAALPSPGAPPPPVAGAGEKVAPFPSPGLAMSTPVFKPSGQRLPGTTVSAPRKLFLSTTERALQGAKAKAQGDVEGEVAGMVAAGIPEDKARAAILLKYERMGRAGARDSFAEGETIRKPDGTWVQILYNRYDPSDTIEMPATDPALKSIAPTNPDAQLASELFGKNYPGMSPNQVLASLDNVQRKALDVMRRSRAAMTAGATARARGDEDIQTELGKPIGVTAGESQNTDPTRPLGSLGGQAIGRPLPTTEVNKLAQADSAVAMVDQLSAALTDLNGAAGTGARQKLATLAPNFVTEYTGWGVDEKSRNAVINLGKQIIGKALESGVLRKEDELKYIEILPTIGDVPDVAASKIQTLKQRLTNDIEIYRKGLGTAGYRIGGPPPPVGGAKEIEYEIVNGQLVRKGGGGE